MVPSKEEQVRSLVGSTKQIANTKSNPEPNPNPQAAEARADKENTKQVAEANLERFLVHLPDNL